jgi:hypothetical protein
MLLFRQIVIERRPLADSAQGAVGGFDVVVEQLTPKDGESTGALIAVVAERRANAALRSSWRLSDRISKH